MMGLPFAVRGGFSDGRASLFLKLLRSYTRISVQEMNPNMRKLEYAVRGPIVQRAIEIEKDLLKVSSLHHLIKLHLL